MFYFLDIAPTSSAASASKRMWKRAKLITSTSPSYQDDNSTKYEDASPNKFGKGCLKHSKTIRVPQKAIDDKFKY